MFSSCGNVCVCVCVCVYMRFGYKIPGMILLQAYL
jgi:hypothetical protein